MRYAWEMLYKKTEVISKLWTVLVNSNQLDEIYDHKGDSPMGIHVVDYLE